jgi:hypothetical protein
MGRTGTSSRQHPERPGRPAQGKCVVASPSSMQTARLPAARRSCRLHPPASCQQAAAAAWRTHACLLLVHSRPGQGAATCPGLPSRTVGPRLQPRDGSRHPPTWAGWGQLRWTTAGRATGGTACSTCAPAGRWPKRPGSVQCSCLIRVPGRRSSGGKHARSQLMVVLQQQHHSAASTRGAQRRQLLGCWGHGWCSACLAQYWAAGWQAHQMCGRSSSCSTRIQLALLLLNPATRAPSQHPTMPESNVGRTVQPGIPWPTPASKHLLSFGDACHAANTAVGNPAPPPWGTMIDSSAQHAAGRLSSPHDQTHQLNKHQLKQSCVVCTPSGGMPQLQCRTRARSWSPGSAVMLPGCTKAMPPQGMRRGRGTAGRLLASSWKACTWQEMHGWWAPSALQQLRFAAGVRQQHSPGSRCRTAEPWQQMQDRRARAADAAPQSPGSRCRTAEPRQQVQHPRLAGKPGRQSCAPGGAQALIRRRRSSPSR